MNPFIVFQQMLVLFTMILIGYFCHQKDIITDSVYPKLSYLVVNIFNPFLVISGITDQSVDKSMDLVLQNICLVFFLFAFLIVISPFLTRIMRLPKQDRPLYGLMSIFSNLGFIGLPLVTAIYGKGAAIYVSFYMLMYNVLIYTYGIYVASKNSPNQDLKFQWKKLLNTGCISSILAIVLFSMQVSLPGAVCTFVSYMGNTAVPLSMILIGVLMSKTGIRKIFTNSRVYLFSFLKLLVLPICLLFAVKQIPFQETVKGIFVLMCGMPVGSLVVLIADEYNIGGEDGVQAIMLTTMLSLFTLPIVVSFF